MTIKCYREKQAEKKAAILNRAVKEGFTKMPFKERPKGVE